MMRQPEGHQNHNDDPNGYSYESEFTEIALSQGDRLRRRVTLHLSKELIGQSGKATHAHPLRVWHTQEKSSTLRKSNGDTTESRDNDIRNPSRPKFRKPLKHSTWRPSRKG
jgi:hypothetical protein